MSNLALAHTPRTDTGTFLNGSWNAGLPLVNLKDGDLGKVARSTNAAATSTIFAVDMGANFTICAVCLAKTNITGNGVPTWRVKGGTAAPNTSNVFTTGQVFDSTAMNCRPMTFAYDVPADWGSQYNLIYVLPTPQIVRYITVDIVDTANPAGFVDLGRLFVPGYMFQPAINAGYGLQDGREELSTFVRADNGKKFFTERTPRPRNVQFTLPNLTVAEGDLVHELDAVLGITKEVLYIPDTADAAKTQRYGFLGNMREMTLLEYPFYNNRAKAYNIEQKM